MIQAFIIKLRCWQSALLFAGKCYLEDKRIIIGGSDACQDHRRRYSVRPEAAYMC